MIHDLIIVGLEAPFYRKMKIIVVTTPVLKSVLNALSAYGTWRWDCGMTKIRPHRLILQPMSCSRARNVATFISH